MMKPVSLHIALHRGLAMACIVLLTACAQTQVSAEHYLLPSPQGQTAVGTDAPGVILHLRELRTAAFLDGEGLVMQLDAISLHEARNHRWAEPLPQQLRRHLRLGLQQQVSGLLLVEDDTGRRADLQLHMELDAFHGRYDGQALVSGRWMLVRPDGALVATRNFSVQVPLADDGYPALVHALARGWNDVTLGIARALSSTPGL